MSGKVKWFGSWMTGAPRLAGVNGDFKTLLEACLVTGFNLQVPNSIEVVDGIATATFGSAHGFEQWSVIEVSGAVPAELNGSYTVLSTTTSTLTFASAAANQTFGGSPLCKTAPLGWEKIYDDVNKIVVRSNNPHGTGTLYRVDNTGSTAQGARGATIRGFESMTDVDTGLGEFPTIASNATGLWIGWSYHENDTPMEWVLAGDDDFIYVGVLNNQYHIGDGFGALYGCGDFIKAFDADQYNAVILAASKPHNNQYFNTFNRNIVQVRTYSTSYTGGCIIRRDAEGLSPVKTATICSGLDHEGDREGKTPHPFNGGIILEGKIALVEYENTSESVFRGYAPGITTPATRKPRVGSGIHLIDVGGVLKPFLCVSTMGNSSVYNQRDAFFPLDTWENHGVTPYA